MRTIPFPGRRAARAAQKHREVLFVGGPADGCRKPVPDAASRVSASHTESHIKATYERLTFTVGRSDVSIFVCELTAAEAFARLLDHYRPDVP